MVDIDLSGLIAMVVLFWSALLFFVIGIISLAVAAFRGPDQAGGIKKHRAFGSFLMAANLMAVNLAGFVVVWYFVDSEVFPNYDRLDDIALYAWLPLQFIIWPVAALIYNKYRK